MGNKSASKQGYSLVEVVVVMAVTLVVLAASAKFIVEVARSTFVTERKLDINADVREITLEMAHNARAANHFYIYKSFNLSDRNEPSDQLRDGNSGDLLVLVFKEPWPNTSSPDHITRLVGYYRDADPTDPNSVGPVKKFEKVYHDPSGSAPAGSAGPYVSFATTTVENEMSSVLLSANHKVVVQLSKGLSDGQLFHNYLNKSIIIKAQIIHGNTVKTVTDTYNYTVSPRG